MGKQEGQRGLHGEIDDAPTWVPCASSRQPRSRLPRRPPDYGKLPLQFEENRGQTDARVRYLARSAGRTLFLTADGAVLSAAGEAVRLRLRGANRTGRDRRTRPAGRRQQLSGPARTSPACRSSRACATATPGRESTWSSTEAPANWSTISWSRRAPIRARIRLEFDGARGDPPRGRRPGAAHRGRRTPAAGAGDLSGRHARARRVRAARPAGGIRIGRRTIAGGRWSSTPC